MTDAPQRLRILTYNVRFFGHGTRGLLAQDGTLEQVAELLSGLGGDPPDIICLQEVESNSLRADLAHRPEPKTLNGTAQRRQVDRFVDALHEALRRSGSDASYRAYYFPAHVYSLGPKKNLYTTGLAILARDSFGFVGDNSESPFEITCRRLRAWRKLKQTRICGHVRLVCPDGTSLDVFNTHLSLPAFLTRDLLTYSHRLGHGVNQLEEAKSLGQFVRERRGEGGLLLMGDFNSLPGSPVYEYVTRELGLRDAYRDFNVAEELHSRDYPTAGVLRLRLPIDYIFSCDRIEWLDFEQTHPFGEEGGTFHGLSDHVPLVGRCRLCAHAGRTS